jgi:predicted Fe-Mo cluster-binding NifX family protein
MIIDANGDGKITGKRTVSTIAHNCGGLPQLLADLGAKVILAGGMGLGPRSAFERKGIEVVLGVSESDPEKAVIAHINHQLVSGQNACEHPDTACDDKAQDELHESCR